MTLPRAFLEFLPDDADTRRKNNDRRDGAVGRGGGFFERQAESDRNPWDSDDELYDEFGRKKRKKNAAPKAGAKAAKAKPDSKADCKSTTLVGAAATDVVAGSAGCGTQMAVEPCT